MNLVFACCEFIQNHTFGLKKVFTTRVNTSKINHTFYTSCCQLLNLIFTYPDVKRSIPPFPQGESGLLASHLQSYDAAFNGLFKVRKKPFTWGNMWVNAHLQQTRSVGFTMRALVFSTIYSSQHWFAVSYRKRSSSMPHPQERWIQLLTVEPITIKRVVM